MSSPIMALALGNGCSSQGLERLHEKLLRSCGPAPRRDGQEAFLDRLRAPGWQAARGNLPAPHSKLPRFFNELQKLA